MTVGVSLDADRTIEALFGAGSHRPWEGKVVLEAVICEDGPILECQVAESSGHGILDQDVVSVLHRASPLSVKHPMGQAQITIPVRLRIGFKVNDTSPIFSSQRSRS